MVLITQMLKFGKGIAHIHSQQHLQIKTMLIERHEMFV